MINLKTGDIVFFSPKYNYSNIDWNDKQIVIDAFKDRIYGFYLNAAYESNKSKQGFAVGLICVATIDFLAKIQFPQERVGNRIEKWLCKYISEFNKPNLENKKKTLGKRFYEEFRNGLVHEGKIKNGGQFSYDFNKIFEIEIGLMKVNPDLFLNKLSKSFDIYIKTLIDNDNKYREFHKVILDEFKEDIELTKG